jgi:hypothetical protein
MTMSHALPVLAVVAWGLTAPASGQDMAVGTWSGTARREDRPATRPASLEIKRVPDPHWRWRGGSGEILGITFVVSGQSNDVDVMSLEAGTLSFSFTDPRGPGTRTHCTLKAQPDGSYEGRCSGTRGNFTLLTLRPPDPSDQAGKKPPAR